MNLESTEKLIQYRHNVPDNPLVSVCVQTYQHAKYIEQCLDGILMQKTSFPFEVLLGEDESTDGTREICIEYAKKHPDKIRLILHRRENVIKIGGQPTGRFNLLYNLKEARGKYIALCEGDDYWTDPYKLQKQVDFLEGNEEYIACAHDVEIKFEDPFDKRIYFYDKEIKNIHEVLQYLYPTCSLFFRTSLLGKNEMELLSNPKVKGGDKLFIVYFFKKGKVKYFNYPMGVYRKHKMGFSYSRKNDKGSLKGIIQFYKEVNKYYDYKYNRLLQNKTLIAYGNLCLYWRRHSSYLKYLYCLINCIYRVKTFKDVNLIVKDYILKRSNDGKK